MRLEALRGNVVPMPGAVALLDWAAAKGLPRALATSSFRGQAEVALTEAALMGRFDVEVTGDEVQFGKPAPDLFLLAAEKLGVSPQSCVVFEDAPAGLEAAARAGMRRVWVPNAHTRHLVAPVEVDATLESLADAIGWLEAQGVGWSECRTISSRQGQIVSDISREIQLALLAFTLAADRRELRVRRRRRCVGEPTARTPAR